MHADPMAEAFRLAEESPDVYRDEPRNARDPREDPQPGDVLAVGNDAREVWERVGGNVEYGFPGKSATRWLPLIRWHTWARNAEVRALPELARAIGDDNARWCVVDADGKREWLGSLSDALASTDKE